MVSQICSGKTLLSLLSVLLLSLSWALSSQIKILAASLYLAKTVLGLINFQTFHCTQFSVCLVCRSLCLSYRLVLCSSLYSHFYYTRTAVRGCRSLNLRNILVWPSSCLNRLAYRALRDKSSLNAHLCSCMLDFFYLELKILLLILKLRLSVKLVLFLLVDICLPFLLTIKYVQNSLERGTSPTSLCLVPTLVAPFVLQNPELILTINL